MGITDSMNQIVIHGLIDNEIPELLAKSVPLCSLIYFTFVSECRLLFVMDVFDYRLAIGIFGFSLILVINPPDVYDVLNKSQHHPCKEYWYAFSSMNLIASCCLIDAPKSSLDILHRFIKLLVIVGKSSVYFGLVPVKRSYINW